MNAKSIGALWEKQSQAGKRFFSGTIEIDGKKIQIVVFENSYKKLESNEPDYRILLSEPREKTQDNWINEDVKPLKSGYLKRDEPIDLSE